MTNEISYFFINRGIQKQMVNTKWAYWTYVDEFNARSWFGRWLLFNLITSTFKFENDKVGATTL